MGKIFFRDARVSRTDARASSLHSDSTCAPLSLGGGPVFQTKYANAKSVLAPAVSSSKLLAFASEVSTLSAMENAEVICVRMIGDAST